MQQAAGGMGVTQTPYFEPTNEFQGMSRASRRRLLTFPKGQAHPKATFDPYAWQEPPEGFYGARLSVPWALLPAEDLLAALLDAPNPVEYPSNANTFNDVNMQTSQAQILYSGDVEPAYGGRNTSDEPVPGSVLVGDLPDTVGFSSKSRGIAGGLINFLDPIMDADPRGAWDPLFHHDNTGVPKGWANRGDGPVRNVMELISRHCDSEAPACLHRRTRRMSLSYTID